MFEIVKSDSILGMMEYSIFLNGYLVMILNTKRDQS